MKQLVVVSLALGLVLVHGHQVLGVVFLVLAAWAVPIVVRRVHDERAASARFRADLAPRADGVVRTEGPAATTSKAQPDNDFRGK